MTNIAPSASGANLARAADFLATLANGSELAVASIVPDGKVVGGSVALPQERAELDRWLAKNGTATNLYFSLNEPKPKTEWVGKGRMKEIDVARIRGVVVDIDPRADVEATEGGYERERARLLKVANDWSKHVVVPPSFIVDSGNGIQMGWLLATPLPNDDTTRAAVKAQAKALGRLLGSDAVQSVDHLFRIPFTENLPNKKKRDKGRTRTTSRLLHYSPSDTYSLQALSALAPPVADAPRASVSVDGLDYPAILEVAGRPDALPPELAARVASMRTSWQGLAEVLANDDRSQRDFALAARVIEDGATDPTEIGQIVFALSPEKLEQKEESGYGATYALGTIKRALEQVKPRPTSGEWFQPTADALPALSGPYVAKGVFDAKALPVRELLISPRLPIGDVSQIVGEPGTSKSTFAIFEAVALATGRESILCGSGADGGPISAERIHRPGASIIYNAEDRLSEMQRRLVAAQRHYGVSDADMKYPIILWSGVDHGPLKIMQRDNDRTPLRRAPEADELEVVIRKHAAVLVVLDPQISLCRGGRENDNDDQDAVMQTLAIMASRLGVCIEVIHHTSKASRGVVGDIGAGRGGFAAVGKVRSAVTIAHVTGKGPDEETWGVTPADGWIRLDYAKVSHDRKPTEPIVFRRVSVRIGNGSVSRPGAAADVFGGSARDRLVAEGDHAPVLELVDLKARTSAAAAGGEVKDKVRGEAIARIADELLDDVDKIKLPDVWETFGARMRSAKLTTASQRGSVFSTIVGALAGAGIAFERDGQSVRIKVTKTHTHATAPWWIVRTKAPNGVGL